jgi:hypothetical protein
VSCTNSSLLTDIKKQTRKIKVKCFRVQISELELQANPSISTKLFVTEETERASRVALVGNSYTTLLGEKYESCHLKQVGAGKMT